MAIRNLMEDVVYSCLKDLRAKRPELNDIGEQAMEDAMALALNKLPPKYVATHRGEVIVKTQIRAQMESDVIRELSAALEVVMKSPRKEI